MRVRGGPCSLTSPSASSLERIVERRNLIAHTGDRKGRGRAAVSIDEVEADLNAIISIVAALDEETEASPRSSRQADGATSSWTAKPSTTPARASLVD
jgi:hypothetical protein